MKVRSWKHEFDAKYRRLLNTGDVGIIDRANDALLKAIEELDRIIKYQHEISVAANHFSHQPTIERLRE